MKNQMRRKTHGNVINEDLRRVVRQTDQSAGRNIQQIVQRRSRLDRSEIFAGVSIPNLADFLIHGENVIVVQPMKIELFDRQVVIVIFDSMRFVRANIEEKNLISSM